MKLLSNTSTTAIVTAGAVLSAVMMVAAPAFAAERVAAPAAAAKTSADSVYEQERARCLSGKSGQSQSTCLKEAGAARDEARRGHLQSASKEELANNAMLRCQRVAEADRQDCRAMVLGQGTRDGSVESGGILTRIDRMVEENPTGAGAPAPAASQTVGPKIPQPRVPSSAPAR